MEQILNQMSHDFVPFFKNEQKEFKNLLKTKKDKIMSKL